MGSEWWCGASWTSIPARWTSSVLAHYCNSADSAGERALSASVLPFPANCYPGQCSQRCPSGHQVYAGNCQHGLIVWLQALLSHRLPGSPLRQDGITAHNDAFRKLPSFIDRLKDGDPIGHYVLKRSGNIISQALIAPFPSRAAFSSLPLSFPQDGCHSRAINNYTLLMATAHDAESHIVVLNWGHCYGESIETWTWCLEQLKDAYPLLNQPH